MAYVIGIILAPVIVFIGRAAGFDRDRAFYATILIVIALYYVLFAVIGGSTGAVFVESLIMIVFLGVAIAGFKYSQWLIVGGMAGHAVLDFFHSHVVANPGVPAWWPAFCGSIDVALAALVAGMIVLRTKGKPPAT